MTQIYADVRRFFDDSFGCVTDSNENDDFENQKNPKKQSPKLSETLPHLRLKGF
jgi:hypothetical protein